MHGAKTFMLFYPREFDLFVAEQVHGTGRSIVCDLHFGSVQKLAHVRERGLAEDVIKAQDGEGFRPMYEKNSHA